jgi:hypothetical protein
LMYTPFRSSLNVCSLLLPIDVRPLSFLIACMPPSLPHLTYASFCMSLIYGCPFHASLIVCLTVAPPPSSSLFFTAPLVVIAALLRSRDIILTAFLPQIWRWAKKHAVVLTIPPTPGVSDIARLSF